MKYNIESLWATVVENLHTRVHCIARYFGPTIYKYSLVFFDIFCGHIQIHETGNKID